MARLPTASGGLNVELPWNGHHGGRCVIFDVEAISHVDQVTNQTKALRLGLGVVSNVCTSLASMFVQIGAMLGRALTPAEVATWLTAVHLRTYVWKCE